MKNFKSWSIILIFMVGIFGCTQKSTSPFKPNSEPDGFGGIKWATEFSEAKSDMVESRSITEPTQPDVKIKIYYTRKGNNLKIGEAQLDKIEYGFWKGKFAEGYITSSGSENFNQLKKFLFENYGTVDKSAQGLYSWNGPVTRIALRYDEPTKTSLLTISSTTISFKEIFDKD
ncbi:MAG: hypothetical protein ACXU9L_06750 [Thermodesulfobacteriota bacterium]